MVLSQIELDREVYNQALQYQQFLAAVAAGTEFANNYSQRDQLPGCVDDCITANYEDEPDKSGTLETLTAFAMAHAVGCQPEDPTVKYDEVALAAITAGGNVVAKGIDRSDDSTKFPSGYSHWAYKENDGVANPGKDKPLEANDLYRTFAGLRQIVRVWALARGGQLSENVKALTQEA